MEKIEDSSIKCKYDSEIPIKIIYNNKEEGVYTNILDLAEDYISKTYLFENKKKEKIAVKLIKKSKIFNKGFFEEMIEIQKSINRPDFSKFINNFEDTNNIFLILEYYNNDSLYDLVNKREYLTEKEVQYYMTQLIISLNYLHTNKIIHRYLIPQFMFLGDKMDLKIGNFFFAIKVENKEKINDKMYTDPFFMAPEIWLSDEYSFEIDIWSLGIIMYYLLTGEYPFNINIKKKYFQSNNYNKEKIKNIFTKLDFPKNKKISPAAKDLITQILVIDPLKRPTLNQIIYHDFFNREIPKYFTNKTINEPPKDFPDGILNKEVIVKDLKSLIKPLIEPITYDSIISLNDLKNNNIKDIDIYVQKYYDYFKKYGIGYILNNGFVGVFYRDRTIMILNTNKNKYKYIEKNKEDTIIFTANICPDKLKNKMKILNEFKRIFNNLNSNGKEEIKTEIIEETKKNEDINVEKDDNDEIDFIYVDNVIFDKYYIFFKLSNQTQQFFFYDKVELIMSCEVFTYKYINDKNEEKTNFYLKDVLNNPIKELKKRYNYARYSYFKWIDNRIIKNIEKIKKDKEKEEIDKEENKENKEEEKVNNEEENENKEEEKGREEEEKEKEKVEKEEKKEKVNKEEEKEIVNKDEEKEKGNKEEEKIIKENNDINSDKE